MPTHKTHSKKPRTSRKPFPKYPERKKGKKPIFSLDGMMKDFLNQISEAAYTVAVKTGFRGTFIHFLSELQEALNAVIQRDQSHRLVRHH